MKNRKNRPVNGKVFRSGVYSTAILAAAILLAVLVNLYVDGSHDDASTHFVWY